MPRVGVIEDDPVHRELVAAVLAQAGFEVSLFGSVREFRRGDEGEVDLLLLDWRLPGESGIDFLRSLRASEQGQRLPVIFLTGLGEEESVVEGLRAGADDYLVKPARSAELVARVEALLRRQAPAEMAVVEDFPPFRFLHGQRQLLSHGEPVALSSREYELLWFLFQRAGRIVGRETLLRQVWKLGPEVNTRTVDTYVSRLRKRLGLNGESGWRLAGVYQHGYRLLRSEPVPESISD